MYYHKAEIYAQYQVQGSGLKFDVIFVLASLFENKAKKILDLNYTPKPIQWEQLMVADP